MNGQDYLRAHGVDLELAEGAGVLVNQLTIQYPNHDRSGELYFRTRYLAGELEGQTRGPKGRQLGLYWPGGRPNSAVVALITEGEPDALAAESALRAAEGVLPPPLVGLTVAAVPGASMPADRAAEELRDAGAETVYLALDADKAGREATSRLMTSLLEVGITPLIVNLPDGSDMADVLVAADDPTATFAELIAEAQAAAEEVLVEGEAADDVEQAGDGDGERKQTQAELLLALVQDAGVELWATPEGDPFMTVPVGEHVENHRLATRAARDWLSHLFYRTVDRPPSAQALQDALGVLRGRALYDGGRLDAPVRYAGHGDGAFLDLGDGDWSAVEITASGWRIVAEAPVRFRRPRGILPLPEPKRGGDLTALRELLNVDDAAWMLIAGWLVGAMAPTGPYPVLALHGEQGAAKSSAARLLRALLDPNVAPLRSEPRDERDLVIAASNGRVVALDNVSSLSASLSDSLCRLATGGGFATRELYSDSEEIIFSAVRPVVLTGIGEVATRGDLLDRAILATLEPISESDRLTEAALEERWDSIAPVAFGALLDAASTALRRLGDVHLERLPRMADHARWVEAAAPALGWKPGEYLAVYGEARQSAVETALEGSPLTEPIRRIAETGFEGSATELLTELADQVGEAVTRSRVWPKSARSLSSGLRRLAPDLRAQGIEITFERNEKRRVIRVQQEAGGTVRHLRQSVIDGAVEPDAHDANDGADAKSEDFLFSDTPEDFASASPDEEAEAERIAAKLGSAA